MAGNVLLPYNETEKKPKAVKVDYSIDINDILAEVQRDYSGKSAAPSPVAAEPVKIVAEAPPAPQPVLRPAPQPTPRPTPNPMPRPAPMPDAAPKPEKKAGAIELDQNVVLEMLNEMQRLTRELQQLRAEVNAVTEHPALTEHIEKRVETPPKKRSKREEKKPQSKGAAILSNVLFYGLLIALVLGAFLMKSNNSGAPFTFAGHSAFTVLTSSMEDTYPKGSLVLTKAVDANELQIGDDITFMISERSSVTHRIVGIIENYQNTGQRAFETKGTMNKDADKDPAIAANVVGKVIFCSLLLGQIAAFITKNWPFMLFLMVVLFALIAFLKWNMNRPDEPEGKKTKRAAPQQAASQNE